jgi:hypothetical protein
VGGVLIGRGLSDLAAIYGWWVILAWIGAAIIPIVLAGKGKKLPRKAYIMRSLPIVVFSVLALIAKLTTDLDGTTSLIAGLVLMMSMVYWSAQRAQDVGISKWWCVGFLHVISAIPIWMLLLFMPTGSWNPPPPHVFR